MLALEFARPCIVLASPWRVSLQIRGDEAADLEKPGAEGPGALILEVGDPPHGDEHRFLNQIISLGEKAPSMKKLIGCDALEPRSAALEE